MATVPVRFEFYCDGGTEQLNFVHDIPQELLRRSHLTRENGAYDDRFMAAVTPILKVRAKDCQDASSISRENCGSRATDILQHVLSWLNKVEDPFIGVYVCAVCGRGECETMLRQELGVVMNEIEPDCVGRRQGSSDVRDALSLDTGTKITKGKTGRRTRRFAGIQILGQRQLVLEWSYGGMAVQQEDGERKI
ncbi:hypothetical protein Purlil1_13329 [Purpureocillium lilacinum]|uniref:Uncharacterized protein n=1 Tax=Purpureocillium lilacinum TaxID=33203 RepID=A0ABR0BEQ9_PURLI|nr:hypothetical protein Purlil1_13329 [Purpureocillium lilacinum]